MALRLKWERFPYESFKYKWMIKQHMHRTFMYLSRALSAQAVYFSLLLNVPAFNVTEIFSWSLRYEGGTAA
jgi:hypothetical protein